MTDASLVTDPVAALTADVFDDAQRRIAPVVHRTPVLTSATLSRETGYRVLLKAELFQRTGSYKIRGPSNKLPQLTPEQQRAGVICSSAGNHAQGVALAAAELGIPAVVVMASNATPAKVAATKAYGAEVVLHGRFWDEANAEAQRIAAKRSLTFVHPFDDVQLIAGQGTVGLELLEDVPDTGVVVVPVGGGGLVSGIAVAVEGRRVVAVEPELSDALHQGLAAGQPVPIEPRSLADGLSAPFAGEHAIRICKERGVESILVSEDELADGMRFLYGRAKLACEPAAAAGVAALLAGKVAVEPRESVVVVVSGGNVAPEIASAILG